jgi:hypothetical protein
VMRYWKSKSFKPGDFARGWCPAHPTFYVRRSALMRMGFFDQTFQLAADADFMMRYLEVGRVKSRYLSHVLVCMRLGGATNRSFGNIKKQNKEILLAMKKNKIPVSPTWFWANKIFDRIMQYTRARFLSAKFLAFDDARWRA